MAVVLFQPQQPQPAGLIFLLNLPREMESKLTPILTPPPCLLIESLTEQWREFAISEFRAYKALMSELIGRLIELMHSRRQSNLQKARLAVGLPMAQKSGLPDEALQKIVEYANPQVHDEGLVTVQIPDVVAVFRVLLQIVVPNIATQTEFDF